MPVKKTCGDCHFINTQTLYCKACQITYLEREALQDPINTCSKWQPHQLSQLFQEQQTL